jgi:hypothetical protein
MSDRETQHLAREEFLYVFKAAPRGRTRPLARAGPLIAFVWRTGPAAGAKEGRAKGKEDPASGGGTRGQGWPGNPPPSTQAEPTRNLPSRSRSFVRQGAPP